MKNNTYFDEMYRIGHEWSEKHDAHEKLKEEIIKTRGWDSEELKAWYEEEEKMKFPFSSGANKAYRAWRYSQDRRGGDGGLLLDSRTARFHRYAAEGGSPKLRHSQQQHRPHGGHPRLHSRRMHAGRPLHHHQEGVSLRRGDRGNHPGSSVQPVRTGCQGRVE